jgi:hypothetical protein
MKMGYHTFPKPVKIVASLIYRHEGQRDKAVAGLIRKFGPIDGPSMDIDFDQTDYYYPEFGAPLKRRMICFARHSSLEKAWEIKRVSNAMEKALENGGKRTVNIDPGYLNDSKLVLFSTKDHAHRIYLSKGIFVELTLQYRAGTFRPLSSTYPDYASERMVSYFNEVRSVYMKGLMPDSTRGRRRSFDVIQK